MSHHDTPTTPIDQPPVALVTGGSSGLGLALVTALSRAGWQVVTDGRDRQRLRDTTAALDGVLAIPGDVTDPAHRAELVAAARGLGTLGLLVNNASTLGPTPLPSLSTTSVTALEDVWAVNVAAPLALAVEVIDDLKAVRGVLISISSDAAVEHYEGWGLYAASKAALDHVTLTLGAENPELAAYAVDPGDLRTPMHQAAFHGEDITDRPLPDAVVPAFVDLIGSRRPSGRYRAAEVAAEVAVADRATA